MRHGTSILASIPDVDLATRFATQAGPTPPPDAAPGRNAGRPVCPLAGLHRCADLDVSRTRPDYRSRWVPESRGHPARRGEPLPGLAPAPGLRADGDGGFILSQADSRKEKPHGNLFSSAA